VIGERQRYGEPEEKESLPPIRASRPPATCHGHDCEPADETVGSQKIPIVKCPRQCPLLLQSHVFWRDVGQKYQIVADMHDADHEKRGSEPDRRAIRRTNEAFHHSPGTQHGDDLQAGKRMADGEHEDAKDGAGKVPAQDEHDGCEKDKMVERFRRDDEIAAKIG
jgi:hypothetical protein